MATQSAPSGLCATCSQPATTHCAGCADTKNTGTQSVTLYCSKMCQNKDWSKHKPACQSAQGRKKLFRAAELIQETFFALKSELLDFNVTKMDRAGDGKIHFSDAPFKGLPVYGPISPCLEKACDIKRAVMFYCAGGDVFADAFYSIAVKAFAGYTTKIEEVDVRVLDSRVLIHRHSTKDTTAPETQSIHHIICVTLKDGTTWAADAAGAQHRQNQPVLPFDKYKQDFVANVLARRPYGSSKHHLGNFTSERRPREAWYEAVDIKLGFIMEHVSDEFEEWLSEHISLKDLIKASASDYSRQKAMLVAHLATTAREFISLSNGDPTSTARLINLNANPAKLSEKDRQRMARKQAREMADMDPSVREMMESAKAQGTEVIML
ncbi:hypothetical protein MBLNU13_g00892t1 [Cladosporium sp. NU13]